MIADPREIAGFQHETEAGLAWYDFICPFCYLAQSRTRILERWGLRIVELPLQAHPEIPVEGVPVGPRSGPTYERIAREAEAAGLPLNWPNRIPNSRLALTAAEWTRRYSPRHFRQLQKGLFGAHFVLGEDIGDPAVIDRYLIQMAIDIEPFWAAVADSSADRDVRDAEAAAFSFGVHGTPAWLVAGRLVEGLRPAIEFERLAQLQQESAA